MRSLATIFIFNFLFFSCNKEPVIFEPLTDNACIQNFMENNDLILAPSSAEDCFFYSIYKFENTYYFSLVCCVCDMITTIVDCSNDNYATMGSEKYDDFLIEAVKLDTILLKK